MILINCSHPLTPDQHEQIERLTHQSVERVISLPDQFDHGLPFAPQLSELMQRVDLSAEQWQTESILVNPPSLNFTAAMLLADLHGRMGYFPPVLRIRPVNKSLPPRYEVAEILNLQVLRDAARAHRGNNAAPMREHGREGR